MSKSVYVEKSEKHRSLAQEIVTLLRTIKPNDEDVEYVMGSVLSCTSNYLGLQHSVPEFSEASILERLSTTIDKDYLRIPSEKDSYFLSSQKEVR